MLGGVILAIAPRSDVVFAQRKSGSRADETGWLAVKVFFPISFGIEKSAIIRRHVLINEDISIWDQVRPDEANARIQAGFQINVQES